MQFRQGLSYGNVILKKIAISNAIHERMKGNAIIKMIAQRLS